MVNLSLEVFEKIRYKGRVYRVVKKFWFTRNRDKAETYCNSLEDKLVGMRSRRFPPFVQEVYISKRWGRMYRVCIPEGAEVKTV